MVSSGSAKVKTEKPWNPEDDNLGKTFQVLKQHLFISYQKL